MPSPFDSLYGFKEMSQVTGMTEGGLSTNLHRARARRKEGKEFNTDMPEPDKYIGSSPVWTEDTFLAWLVVRASDNTDVRILKPIDPVESLRQRKPIPLAPRPVKDEVEEVPVVIAETVTPRKGKRKGKRKK
jgi:hypothetical protein